MTNARKDELWAALQPRFALIDEHGQRVSEWVTDVERGGTVRIKHQGQPVMVTIGIAPTGGVTFTDAIGGWHLLRDGDELEQVVDLGG